MTTSSEKYPSLPQRAPWEGYKKIRAIASGGAGQVFIAEKLPSSTTTSSASSSSSSSFLSSLVIFKRIFIDNAETLKQAEIEVATMRDIPDHVNCTRILDAFRDSEDYVNIIQDYCCVGDCDRLMTAKREAKIFLTVEEVAFLAAQTLVGLRHLHKNKIVHRDMKPSNVCLDFFWRTTATSLGNDENNNNNSQSNSSSSSFAIAKERLIQKDRCHLWNLLKFSDQRKKYLAERNLLHEQNNHNKSNLEEQQPEAGFGSHNCSSDGDSVTPCSACLARVPLSECCVKIADFGVARTLQGTASMRSTVLGTAFYLAPELVNAVPYTYPVDLWAFGCVMWELATTGRDRLFSGDNMLAVVMAITMAKIKPLPPACEALMPMIHDVVVEEPERRLSADGVLKKFFFS